ncbi:MAG TPA: hypothetical protein VD997_08950 [Phycisphaerales bacterium]|nr:hypothetical protein [Phycisphaerales bacterium]
MLPVVAMVALLAAVGALVGYILKTTRPAPANGEVPLRSEIVDARTRPLSTGKPADTKTIDAVLNSAQTYLNNSEPEKAEAVLKGAIAQHAGEQSFYLMYAELLAGQKRLAESYDNYVKALAIGPRDAATELAAGTVANLQGLHDRAVEHFMAAQTANPSDDKPPLYLAAVQVKLNQKDEAKKNYLLAAKLNPDNATPWAALAQLALDENKLDLARQHIEKARTLQPANTTFRLIESRALKRQGKAEEALQLLVNLDAAQKRLPGVMPQIAECYGLLQRPRDAALLYATASDEEPANAQWAYEAALWFDRALDKVQALKYAQRAAALNAEGAAKLVERLSQ